MNVVAMTPGWQRGLKITVYRCFAIVPLPSPLARKANIYRVLLDFGDDLW